MQEIATLATPDGPADVPAEIDAGQQTAPQVIETINPETAEKIARNSCVLEIHRHEPSFVKKVDSAAFLKTVGSPPETQLTTGIDPQRLNVSKHLVDRKEIRNLQKHRRNFFATIKDMSLPGGLLTLGNGQFLIPLSRVAEAKAKIDRYLSERDALLDEFEARYAGIIERSKERLGPLYDEADYPPFAAIRSLYSTSYKFISNAVPEELTRVSQEIYEQEKQRVLAECQGLVPMIQENLRGRFLDIVNHFKERLGADEKTGKRKRFHGSNVERLKEFIATFAEMNLTGDADLAVLVEQSKALVEGADVEKIRTDDEFRAKLESSFAEIKLAADKLVTTQKRRVILED